MKELHFIKAGNIQVAYRGNWRLTMHKKWPGVWAAQVFERHTAKQASVSSANFLTKAAALDWLAAGDRAMSWPEVVDSIEATATGAVGWMRGRPSVEITSAADAKEARKLRADLEELKRRAIDDRNAERLPLITKVQKIEARYAPKLDRIITADDLLRHALKAWERREKKAKKDRPSA